ncbi:MAG: DUF2500 domain-containing protein [Planctomycetes bacterium]|nr:DUF2500 domain-containing protein [Planctomycetota bacterium]
MHDTLVTLVPILVGLGFVFVIGSLVFKATSGVAEWSNNNSLPVLEVPAIVVNKRVDTKIRRHRHNHGTNHIGHTSTSSSNTYYITFENKDNSERHVFSVNQREFDQIIENDSGYLTHQGTRYHKFNRDHNV